MTPFDVSHSAFALAMPGRAISVTFGTPWEATETTTTSTPSSASSKPAERNGRTLPEMTTLMRGCGRPSSMASMR